MAKLVENQPHCSYIPARLFPEKRKIWLDRCLKHQDEVP